MKNINKIFWGSSKIDMLTNQINAETHSHYMLQVFLGIDDIVEIIVNGKLIKCDCIVIDKNISHSFSAQNKVYYSSLIDPTSIYATKLANKMNGQGYFIYDSKEIKNLREVGKSLMIKFDIEEYSCFEKKVNELLGIFSGIKKYDKRISELFNYLNSCDCYNHSIAYFAGEVGLSSSRLSHLFKEQTGIPLKSYILLHQMERAFSELFAGKNITQASMIAGFDSSSHFAGTVKRMMGMPVTSSLKDSEFLKVY